MNILMTSVGRRSYLVDYFKAALGGNGLVVGANMYPEVAGMYASDVRVIAPPACSDEYVPFVFDICCRYEIGLLLSLHDLDVFVLSKHKQQFADAGVINTLPSEQWGRMALDKYQCGERLQSAGIPIPWTSWKIEDAFAAINSSEISYPVLVKARIGFGSLGLAVCKTDAELKVAYLKAKESVIQSGANQFLQIPDDQLVIIQPLITGREVCVGVVNDLAGRYKAHFACQVHSMRAGESERASTIDRSEFDSLAKTLSKLTEHAGIWGIDCLEDQGVFRVIDVNPRFTGDYPFHHLAGANVPAALIAWAKGGSPADSCFKSRPDIVGYKDLVPKIFEGTSPNFHLKKTFQNVQ
jgi:carbamoyl-phosphate synthase large subunit